MSTKELRVYVLEHRLDVEALEVLFSRRTPDSEAIIYPSMFTEDGKECGRQYSYDGRSARTANSAIKWSVLIISKSLAVRKKKTI
ncbi:MAG: hypothetical protein PUP91_21775 [Rhizonema sp. PD37]|nr:hypothetical protein [Rhizonema sp. PD37]